MCAFVFVVDKKSMRHPSPKKGSLSIDLKKPSAGKRPPVFINVGRGSVTDEAAILKALDENWLRLLNTMSTSLSFCRLSGCVLDVFAKEPLASSSPLWKHPRILITPHISAPSFAEVNFDQIVFAWIGGVRLAV